MTLLVDVFVFLLSWRLVLCDYQRDKVFILQKLSGDETKTVLVVTWNEEEVATGCEIFTDNELVTKVLKSSDAAHIRTLSEEDMANALEDCKEFNWRRRKRESGKESTTIVPLEDITHRAQEYRVRRRTTPSQRTRNRNGRRTNETNLNSEKTTKRANVMRTTRRTNVMRTTRRSNVVATKMNVNDIQTTRGENDIESTTAAQNTTTLGYDGLPVIFPGTKWCGAGAVAKNYSDLGRYRDTDECCRDHDLCNDTLAPGETRHNLTNTSPFTKLSCQCDEAFYSCLDRVNTIPANTIGNMYFNLLRRECYKKDYPFKCMKYMTFLKLTCIEDGSDTTERREYRWYPAKRYKNVFSGK